MAKPLAGGSRWTQEGIEPAKAYWTQIYACQKAALDRIRELPEGKVKQELLQIITDQAVALTGQLKALHEIELIGIEAKKERLDDG